MNAFNFVNYYDNVIFPCILGFFQVLFVFQRFVESHITGTPLSPSGK